VLSVLLIVLFISLSIRERVIPYECEMTKKAPEDTLLIRKERAEIYENLKSFINSDLDLPSKIKSFEFEEGSSRVINLTFTDGSMASGEIVLNDSGEVTGIKTPDGLISRRASPEDTLELLVSAYEFNSGDSHRVSYLNKALDEAVSSGNAVFNLLEYERTDADDLRILYGPLEKQAFCRFLTNKYFKTADFISEFEILLTPNNEPV